MSIRKIFIASVAAIGISLIASQAEAQFSPVPGAGLKFQVQCPVPTVQQLRPAMAITPDAGSVMAWQRVVIESAPQFTLPCAGICPPELVRIASPLPPGIYGQRMVVNDPYGNFARPMPAVDPNAGIESSNGYPGNDYPGNDFSGNSNPSGDSADFPEGETRSVPYYSPKLQAQFVTVPGRGRAITYIDQFSPLKSAGMEVGDIITHLDGIPVQTDWELENHYSWTLVYGIDWQTERVITRKIFIP